MKIPSGTENPVRALRWIVGLWICLQVSCAQPHHPPTFADFKRVRALGVDTDEGVQAGVRLMELAQFTKEEKEEILQRGKVEEMIGAAVQAPLSDEMALRLLRRATEIKESDFFPWQALASLHLSLWQNRRKDFDSETQFALAIERVCSLKPENAFPIYLRALSWSLKGNNSEARRLMESGSQQPVFSTSNRQIRECVVLAAEAAGYPKYTARMMALGQSRDAIFLLPLAKGLLTNGVPDEPFVKACLRMGQRLEADGQLFIELLIAYQIQKEALKHLTGSSHRVLNDQLEEKKKEIHAAARFLQSDAVAGITEKRWVAYFDTVFKTSELEATQILAKELGKPLASGAPR